MSSPKVFISFLGTTEYVACNYVDDKGGGRCDNVRFIQTAVRRLHCPDADKAIIFVTEKAETDNLPALQQECVDNSLPKMAPKRIPIGEHEDELWEIFRIVGDAVPKDSELFFDITHSFRSLPVLMTTLLNYLREVKGVRPAGCYYGAFEKLGRSDQVKQMPLEKRDAPIFDLTRFLDLNDWTDAIGQFTDYGRTEGLLKQTRDNLSAKVQKSRERDRNAEALRDVVKAVNGFSDAAHTANCEKLYKMNIRQDIIEPLSALNYSALAMPQLGPVLEQVREMFADYEDSASENGDGGLKNGLRAALWCARHHLYPQGFTILRETVLSFEIARIGAEKLSGIEKEQRRREFLSDLLNGLGQKKPFQEMKWRTDEEQRIAGDLTPGGVPPTCWDAGFLGDYVALCDWRNKVNHGGTGGKDQYDANSLDKALRTLSEKMLAHYGL